jgi:hypothetical protein
MFGQTNTSTTKHRKAATMKSISEMFPMKHAFATICLNAGISVALTTDSGVVRELVNALHPIVTEHPLIRIGARGDGGYLIPDDLEEVVACFSPGVDNRATFEAGIIERGIPCFLADGSVISAPINGEMVHFTNKHLGVNNSDATMTLDHWVERNKPGNDDLILQMDIEGAEWAVLLNVSRDTLRRFRIIVIEMHDLERLMDKHAFFIIKSTFERLLDDFYIVHNHPNNYGRSVRHGSFVIPRVQEMTLIRKDRVKSMRFARTFVIGSMKKTIPTDRTYHCRANGFVNNATSFGQAPAYL